MCLEISRGIWESCVSVEEHLKNFIAHAQFWGFGRHVVLLLIPVVTNPCLAKLLELMMDETTPSTYFNGTSELKCQVCYMHFLTI
jgi:hypothetical protein